VTHDPNEPASGPSDAPAPDHPPSPGAGAARWRVLDPVLNERRALIVVASPKEAEAVFYGLGVKREPAVAASQRQWEVHHVGDRFDVLITGIGKANAAGAVGRALDVRHHAAVLSIGVAGMLPGSTAELGQIILGDRSVSADDGLATPVGFLTAARMGFPLGPFPESGVPVDPAIAEVLRPQVDGVTAIATVSTCSGTDAHAQAITAVTGAGLEAMEGAAIAQVTTRLGVPFAEVRTVSNTTGDRNKQVWVVQEALEKLTHFTRRL
jgi:futalosine hydrolase